MIRPGLCSITLRSLRPADVIAVATDAGLEGIEWGADVHVPPGELDLAEAVGEATRDAGLAVPSYGSYLRAGDPSGIDHAQVAAVLDTAVALGAPNVRVWTRWGMPGELSPAGRDGVVADLSLLVEACRDRGLVLSLERHVATATETVEGTLELLAAVAAPELYTYWQPLDGVATPEALTELAALGEHLSHLHVFQWTSFDDRHPLADGEDRWPAVLAGVSAAEGARWIDDRWALLEYVRGDDPNQVATDAATLTAWLADVRG